ncbi:hypothetical protein [Lentzea terrae]|nr:hypothetical protein [Lentzea terrae]
MLAAVLLVHVFLVVVGASVSLCRSKSHRRSVATHLSQAESMLG